MADDDFMMNMSFTPRIASRFTNWKYKDMRHVVDFCEKCDKEDRDLRSEAVRSGMLREECSDPQVPLT